MSEDTNRSPMALITPSILRRERVMASLNAKVAAERIGVPLHALLTWEGGIADPTFDQLSKLADLYGRPTAWFFLPDIEAAEKMDRESGTEDTGGPARSEAGGPPHYYRIPQGATELRHVIEALGMNFNLGNALKYLYRAGRKPSADYADDLRKAADYIRWEINRVARKGAPSGE